jgi:hypothetical protein
MRETLKQELLQMFDEIGSAQVDRAILTSPSLGTWRRK